MITFCPGRREIRINSWLRRLTGNLVPVSKLDSATEPTL
jgi:hypothetical protein